MIDLYYTWLAPVGVDGEDGAYSLCGLVLE